MENAAGIAACAVAASACSAQELELGEETCEGVGPTSPSGDCSMDMSCRRPITLGVATDARVYLMRFGSSRCERSGSGSSLECSCRYQGADEEYELLVEGDSTGCGPLVELCMSGGAPDYDGEEECLITSAEATDEGCEKLSACLVPSTIAEGVRLGVAEPRFASCERAEGGGSDCYCSTSTSSFQLRTSAPPSAATCDAVQVGCAPGAVIEPTGDAACEPTSQSSSASTSCDADLDCTQSATVDGQDVVAIGRLFVRCARTDEDNPWWCSCASDQATARFSLGMTGADSAEACGQAPARCLEELDVHLGPYGSFMQPPDPLP